MKLVIPLHFIPWKKTPNDAMTPQRQCQLTPWLKQTLYCDTYWTENHKRYASLLEMKFAFMNKTLDHNSAICRNENTEDQAKYEFNAQLTLSWHQIQPKLQIDCFLIYNLEKKYEPSKRFRNLFKTLGHNLILFQIW